MKPYVLSLIAQEDAELFAKIQRVVEKFPDIDFGKGETGEKLDLSCHILARAIGKVFGLRHVDGYFYPNFKHTWLVTGNGNVIDVYPVGMLGGPILVDGSDFYSPARWIYKKKRILQGKSREPSFRRALRMSIAAVRKIVASE